MGKGKQMVVMDILRIKQEEEEEAVDGHARLEGIPMPSSELTVGSLTTGANVSSSVSSLHNGLVVDTGSDPCAPCKTFVGVDRASRTNEGGEKGVFGVWRAPCINLRNLLVADPADPADLLDPKPRRKWQGVAGAAARTRPTSPILTGLYCSNSAALVATANPRLFGAIERLVVDRWKLDHYSSYRVDQLEDGLSGDSNSTGGYMDKTPDHCRRRELARLHGRTKEEMEDALGPMALMSTLATCMVKMLVDSGVECYRRDESVLRTTGPRGGRGQARWRGGGGGLDQTGTPRRILTVSHVVRGLAMAGREEARRTRVLLGSLLGGTLEDASRAQTEGLGEMQGRSRV